MKKIQFLFICLLLLFCFNKGAYSNSKLNVGAGYGFRDFININVEYLIDNDVGLVAGIGYLPGHISTDDYSIDNTTRGRVVFIDIYKHFGEPSKLSGIPHWFFRYGVSHLLFQDFNSDDDYYKRLTEEFIINIQIGREINFSKNIGMRIMVGLSYSISEKLIYGEYPESSGFFPFLDLRLSSIPINIGFNIFYRF